MDTEVPRGRLVNPGKDKLDRQSFGQSTCGATGKRIYATRKQARRARAQLIRGHELNVYRCDGCTGYHVGHMPAEVRRGERDKSDWLANRRLAPREQRRPW